ncbi:MAG: hypothetical protein NTZ97_00825 [Candidatus Moranbacteria bacterium]|nr:hypothetical protein [Candidatus Moranbacteria bacterium]
MRKKYLVATAIFAGIVILAGCGKNNNTVPQNSPEAISEKPPAEEAKSVAKNNYPGPCEEKKVTLENYGDPGKRLKSCFVEYPGEPTRQDKSYYVLEDICGQFTKEFIENMLGQRLAKIELPKIDGIYNCTYYFDDKEYVMLNLEYLSVENQKTGNEAMGFKVEKNPQIPMDNLMATQTDGAINVIYLILGPEKFLSLRPSSKVAIANEAFINLAAKIGAEIKNYK